MTATHIAMTAALLLLVGALIAGVAATSRLAEDRPGFEDEGEL